MQSQLRNGAYTRNLHKLYVGGLVIVSLVILPGLLTPGKLDLSAWISLLAFSVALPLLAATPIVEVMQDRFPQRPHGTAIAKVVHIAFILGVFIDLIGISAAFWHPTWIAGVVFLCSLLATFVIHGIYIMSLNEDTRPH